ncbi:MAG: hypothetical protein ACXQTU_04905 [Candidatus Nezhaarchaeales archaeon]
MNKSFVICITCSNFYVKLCCGMICEVYGSPRYWLKGYCPSYKPIPKKKPNRINKKIRAS